MNANTTQTSQFLDNFFIRHSAQIGPLAGACGVVSLSLEGRVCLLSIVLLYKTRHTCHSLANNIPLAAFCLAQLSPASPPVLDDVHYSLMIICCYDTYRILRIPSKNSGIQGARGNGDNHIPEIEIHAAYRKG